MAGRAFAISPARAARGNALFPLVARAIVAAVFLYAGASKLSAPDAFADAIGRYRLVPRLVAEALAFYLPWLEIACGAGVLWSRLRAGALAVASTLAVLFALAVASALARGLDIDCGCFGAQETAGRRPLALSLGFDMILAAACVALGWIGRQRRDPSTI